MNERIRLLAVEAGFYANPDVEKFEKFADMIVKECAGIAHGSDQPSADIKYYFGVEE